MLQVRFRTCSNEIHDSGNWWYDIIDFDVVVQGKPTKVHVHGGLFKSCYPSTYKGTFKIIFIISGPEIRAATYFRILIFKSQR